MPRLAAYRRRREERLRLEDEQRALRAQERELIARQNRAAEDLARGFRDLFITQQARADALALGQVLPH
jgi:hypothetical protein